MNVITLFYGQCGNQISDALYSNLHSELTNSKQDDYYTQCVNKWFHVTKSNKLEARSILVDTECKAIPKKKLLYQHKNVIAKSCGGSANNWAFGYLEQSKILISEIEDCIRKELERSDLCSSFLNVFSTSGGTGAGVGSAVIELLKNEFPNRRVVNSVVLPYADGELVTQSYNSLLVLSKIYSLSDVIIVFENDRLHYNCTNSLSLKNVAFDDINNLISRQLLSIYQPLKENTTDLLKKLCENEYKFLQVKISPLSRLDNASNWKSLLTSLSRQSRFDFYQKAQILKPKILSAAVICRGNYNPAESDLKPFNDLNSCKTVKIYHQRKKLFNLENFLSVVTNSNHIFTPINGLLQDARNLFKFGAYLHHYKKFGVPETQFKASFDTVEQILDDYKKL